MEIHKHQSSDLITDANGPCEMVAVLQTDGSYLWVHAPPNEKREFRKFVAEQIERGNVVNHVGLNRNIKNIPIETLFKRGHTLS